MRSNSSLDNVVFLDAFSVYPIERSLVERIVIDGHHAAAGSQRNAQTSVGSAYRQAGMGVAFFPAGRAIYY